jgi:hypothetical protein
MKKFTNVIVSLNTRTGENEDIEVVTGDDLKVVEDVTRRTLIAWGEVDFKALFKVRPDYKRTFLKDPEKYYEDNCKQTWNDITIFRDVEITDADLADEDFRREESMDRRR